MLSQHASVGGGYWWESAARQWKQDIRVWWHQHDHFGIWHTCWVITWGTLIGPWLKRKQCVMLKEGLYGIKRILCIKWYASICCSAVKPHMCHSSRLTAKSRMGWECAASSQREGAEGGLRGAWPVETHTHTHTQNCCVTILLLYVTQHLDAVKKWTPVNRWRFLWLFVLSKPYKNKVRGWKQGFVYGGTSLPNLVGTLSVGTQHTQQSAHKACVFCSISGLSISSKTSLGQTHTHFLRHTYPVPPRPLCFTPSGCPGDTEQTVQPA